MNYDTLRSKINTCKMSLSGFFQLYSGKPITKAILEELAIELSKYLKVSSLVTSASIGYLEGSLFTDDVIDPLIHRLIANQKRLKMGEAIIPLPYKYALTEVIRIDSLSKLPGDVCRLKCTIITGCYASNSIRLSIPYRLCNRLMIGAGLGTRKYPLLTAERGLPGVLIKVKLNLRTQSDFGLESVLEDDSVMKWNRENVFRYRLNLLPCPHGICNTIKCWDCSVGRDMCFAAFK